MTTIAPWSGRKVQEARKLMAQTLPAPCGECGKTVHAHQPWVIGHKLSRATHPHLTWMPSNWRVEHRACSDRTGQRTVIAKARAEALAEHGIVEPDFPQNDTLRAPAPSFISLPTATSPAPITIRDDLTWSAERLTEFDWLLPLLDVPTDAGVPLAMTPPHPDAVGTYGWDAVAWIEDSQKVTLRWWQRLCLVRILEHREDGSLIWRKVLKSASRRSGKSVLLRGLALWRMAHADLFGEVQNVMHFGSDLAICREVQRGAWRWAEDVAGWTVTRANGKEQIESLNNDRWLVRAQSAVYGYDVCLGLGDECWDVPVSVIDDGVEPAMLERLSPQLVLTSTAHPRATSLMRDGLSSALAAEDGLTLLLLWGALPSDDPGSPSTWRKASPHWSADRETFIAAKWLAAQANEDPEFDDGDPIESFCAQYLNVWRLSEKRKVAGKALTSADAWSALTGPIPDRTPDAVAIESDFGGACSTALAWRERGRVIVSVVDSPDLASAVAAADDYGFAGRLIVGASLATDPALKGRRLKPEASRLNVAVAEFARLLPELRHDGAEHLTGQVLGMRTVDATDGQRVVSKERNDALKAATWAASAARKPGLGKPRIIVARY